MNLVTLEHVSKQYSERLLLDDVNLLINEGERIGLIGVNGSGKTTLLRIIAGLEPVDSGTVTVWGGVRIEYLPQEPQLEGDFTVLEHIFRSDAPQLQLLRRYEETAWLLLQAPENEALQERLMALSLELDRQDGWSAEAKAKTILTQLGVPQFHTRVGELSGGQRKRVAE